MDDYVKLATDGTSGMAVTVYHDPHSLFPGSGPHRTPGGDRLPARRKAVPAPPRVRRLEDGHALQEQPSVPPPQPDPRRASVFGPVAAENGFSRGEREADQRVQSRRPALLRLVRGGVVHPRPEKRRRFRPPRVVIYGGDAISEPVRRMIAERFGADVISEYGAGEAQQIGVECERHYGLHVNSDLYPVRIVDEDGREVPDGRVRRCRGLEPRQSRDRPAQLPARGPGEEAGAAGACGRSLPLHVTARGAYRRLGRVSNRRAGPCSGGEGTAPGRRPLGPGVSGRAARPAAPSTVAVVVPPRERTATRSGTEYRSGSGSGSALTPRPASSSWTRWSERRAARCAWSVAPSALSVARRALTAVLGVVRLASRSRPRGRRPTLGSGPAERGRAPGTRAQRRQTGARRKRLRHPVAR